MDTIQIPLEFNRNLLINILDHRIFIALVSYFKRVGDRFMRFYRAANGAELRSSRGILSGEISTRRKNRVLDIRTFVVALDVWKREKMWLRRLLWNKMRSFALAVIGIANEENHHTSSHDRKIYKKHAHLVKSIRIQLVVWHIQSVSEDSDHTWDAGQTIKGSIRWSVLM